MPDYTPRYPIYIPSKGRFENCLTAKWFDEENIDFRLVVEEPEHAAYASRFGEGRVLVLPFQNQGLIAARNWIRDHSQQAGFERHWQFDDNIREMWRVWRNRRIMCAAAPGIVALEDFVDRYENVGVAGFNYESYPIETMKPFQVNCHVYSATLFLNALPYRWRALYNDDTDMCLQVLSGGWCTVLFNAFLVKKMRTMTVKGGNTADLYQGDGRLKMARSLERQWPGVVTTRRRFGRPQHVVKNAWMKFDTPLKLKPGVDLSAMKSNEYGLKLKQRKPIKSVVLQALLDEETSDTK
jgi:hypothetical protein